VNRGRRRRPLLGHGLRRLSSSGRSLAAMTHGPVPGLMRSGRGCLFGPVFAGAVVLPASALEPLARAGLTDSKALSARHRERLVP